MEENNEKTTDEALPGKESLVKSAIALKEEAVLSFWKENTIFEKTEEKRDHVEEFIFYDGPPFATGLPHYGHLLGGTIKDAVPRYQTMKGKRVVRKWGWDCHGLPIENLIEKELGLKTKKDIEDLGIGKFNTAAKNSVLRYEAEWKKIVPRFGRFVDMANPYKTMDAPYSETIWWIFKNLFDRKLIYKGFKSMHICPRCETTLSNFEVNQGYKDVKDISVYAKFELVDEPGTFVIAWTTTPWTLPGNAALAINPDIEYVKILVEGQKIILAKDRLSVLKDKKYELVDTFSAKELLGKKYKPLFDYYVNDAKLEFKENAWKIYGADFVTTTDGTGVVHIAPAFGTDDYNLSRKESLPFLQHVGMEGKFKKEVKDFAGQSVKPKSEDDKVRFGADIAILKYLQDHGTFFAKENLVHSYPHCWRCETPLLNYATSSWFVKVSAIKDQIVAENKKINWIPEEIGQGRFGKWIEGAPDWAISRSRYWGAPLPAWECAVCEKTEVLGSLEDLKKKTTRKNRFLVMRHGEAENNKKQIISCLAENPHHLTELGRKQVTEAIEKLKDEKIDVIVASPFVRTRETADIIAQGIGFDKRNIITDARIGEANTGIFNLKSLPEYHAFFSFPEEVFVKKPPQGENFLEMKKRMGDALYDLDSRYEGKTILIITHDTPAHLLFGAGLGKEKHWVLEDYNLKSPVFLQNAEIRPLDFAQIPHNENYELDFHRPYIDEVTFTCECGGKMKRVPEVFDCWFESGAMPYGQNHYPFENKNVFDPEKGIGFPADFIAEGLDQTRGWFYSLIVLGVALFGKSPYKNVVVNGLVLAEDGKKMSKSLNNYPDPMVLFDKYGADAVRYYLLSSPVTHAEDLNFSEKGVDEVMKKITMRLENVVSFYELYCGQKSVDPEEVMTSEHVLDQWIIARLDETVKAVAKGMDAYEMDRATWPIMDFADDLSTWYLRRSRDRFKSEDANDKKSAIETTQFVLFQFSKVLAPFMPFLAEGIFECVKGSKKQSVHLESWPVIDPLLFSNERITEEMKEVRKIVALSLEARARAGVRVRQPLQSVTIKNETLKGMHGLLELISDEVNVKEVLFNENLVEEVVLDTKISEVLKEEGQVRDLIRSIQEFRKKMKLNPNDIISLVVGTDASGQKFFQKNQIEIARATLLGGVSFEEVIGEKIVVDSLSFVFALLQEKK